jgi:hypothetical protein
MIEIPSKTAYEEYWRTHDFARASGDGKITTGETVSTATVTVTDNATGDDVSSTMVSDVSAYGSPPTQVKFFLKGGTARHGYTVSVKAVTSNGQKFEDRLSLKVI